MSLALQTETRSMPKARPAFSPVASGLLQRKCTCGGTPGPDGECAACKAKRLALQRRAASPTAPAVAPPIVHEVLRSPGQPLDAQTRAFMEPRFGHDFSQVRIHNNDTAAKAAKAIRARAYTVGQDIVFGSERYAPATAEGQKVLAHELTHTVQQHAEHSTLQSKLEITSQDDTAEQEAEAAAAAVSQGRAITPIQALAPQISRQDDMDAGTSSNPPQDASLPGGVSTPPASNDTGSAGDAGSTGGASTPAIAAAAPFQVCSRALQISPVGNHAYIEAPPFRYAIISPTCPQNWYDTPATATSGQKWDNSPDPCGNTPTCIDCLPAPGVTDVARCLRDTFTAYANPSKYNLLGPNSNTFAGTLARACCAGMTPKPAALGLCPGWDDSPAPYRGGKPCPPGPTC